jgi:hypothetical protein
LLFFFRFFFYIRSPPPSFPLLLLFLSEMTLNFVFNGISLHPSHPSRKIWGERRQWGRLVSKRDGDAEMRPILYSYSLI